MTPLRPLPAPLVPGQPLTALAPMQEITDLGFMRVIAHYGAPDYFFTEFFRVHSAPGLERHILRSIDENTTGRPVFAQLIGEDLGHLQRTVAELLEHPVAGIDLNLGCPAPKVYRKSVGGGLLREPDKVDSILRTLRAVAPGPLTVKMRIGFDSTEHFDRILDLINAHGVDLLSVHGRTVKEMYRSDVHYDFIARAVARVRCPVLANGNVTTPEKAAAVLAQTGSAGVMIGRHAIRNPWIFRQCRERFSGMPVTRVTLEDLRGYVERLYRATMTPNTLGSAHVRHIKRYLNFVGAGVDATGDFLHAVRRASDEAALFAVCDQHLLSEPQREFTPEPYPSAANEPSAEPPQSNALAQRAVEIKSSYTH